MVWGCVPSPSLLSFKGGGASCSLCIRLMMTSNSVTHDMQKLSGPYNFPHRKPSRCLVTFWVLLWVAENASKNRSVPSSPRRGLQPKNVSCFSPFQNRHCFLEQSPSFPTQQLLKEKPPTWRLDFHLAKGRELSLDSRKKKHFLWTSKNRSSKSKWLQGRRYGSLTEFLPPEDQLIGTMY